MAPGRSGVYRVGVGDAASAGEGELGAGLAGWVRHQFLLIMKV
ncbi:Uncharacterised protein [Nocardia brasiliensis]|nr:Uncharacterised protein [Nocardia brasiliensis]